DRGDRADHALIVGPQESDGGNEQSAGIELPRAICLHERPKLWIEGFFAHLIADFLADGAPSVERAFEAECFSALDRAIECNPRLDFGIGEMLASAAYFPNAFVGRLPHGFQVREQRALKVPARFEIA